LSGPSEPNARLTPAVSADFTIESRAVLPKSQPGGWILRGDWGRSAG
jgi:hypothetical protein